MPNAKASFIAILFVIIAIIITGTSAGSKDKPHIHNGFIEPFDGKPLPAVLSEEELVRLDKGEAVSEIFYLIAASRLYVNAFRVWCHR